ncbi:MAG: hypothetical protein WA996_14420 [Candidatus Promineifilaceae bacterium]
MRFLMREMEYEKPIASGRLRYEREGNPTGLVEAWRFTHALEGFYFLRVEMDAHNPKDQEICLYHVLLNPEMNIERLKFRYFGSRSEVEGDLQFDRDIISLNRVLIDKLENRKKRQVEEIAVASDAVFWFPSMVGLGFASSKVTKDSQRSFLILDKDSSFASRRGTAQFRWGDEEDRAVMRRNVAVRPCSISWETFAVRLWLDEFNWPVGGLYADGLSATEIAYVRYEPVKDRRTRPV